eukprot:RCo039181
MVQVHLYDLSRGLAARVSVPLLGRPLAAVWHSSVVVFGKEYYYEGGISCTVPGSTRYGTPTQVLPVGETLLPMSVYELWTMEVEHARYSGGAYHILRNNCNHFTQEAVLFLTGKPLPESVGVVPTAFLQSSLGKAISPFIDEVMQLQQECTAQMDAFLASQATPPRCSSALLFWECANLALVVDRLLSFSGPGGWVHFSTADVDALRGISEHHRLRRASESTTL